nr:RNA-directed DNA polymerase, eukaryota, reverse transcriptase zinc-binding domain protein [Tanacetum cinerariifolium]
LNPQPFDSLRWDYLDEIMEKLGFGSKWRNWIVGCLSNSRTSILVNGTPTVEFEILKGLRQGDPLSPFLFIIAMEGLHAITSKAVNIGMFKGVSIREGVPVGCNMNRIDNWKCIVQKFALKLSQWKARLLSVGGRVSLIKSVLCNLPTYYLSLYKMPTFVLKKLESMHNKFFIRGDLDDKKATWVKWNVCLASKATGGLGIGSIYALNMSLLFKWIWRFRSNSSDLWVKVIRSIHEHDGGIENRRSSAAFLSPWKDEKWCGDMLLKDRFPFVFALEGDKNCNVADHLNISDWGSVFRRPPRGGVEACQFEDLQSLIQEMPTSDKHDGWNWSFAPNGFSVASARKYIDVHILPCGLSTTRWNR